MKTAFLFPGQGSQYVGMGRDLYEAFPEARARFESADDLLGFALTDVLFGDEADPDAAEATLRQTDLTQPALYVHSLAVMAVLERQGQQPDMTAGHSLGEYSALAAAGVLTFEDGLRAVRRRGELMAGADDARPGTMAAILGLEDEAVARACIEATEAGEGVVQPANFNAPGQVVISGDVAAVERAMEVARAHGAKRVVPLTVGGAFHSPLMEQARQGLADLLGNLEIRRARCPVYLNVTARPTTDPDEIRVRLLEQLIAPVRWSQALGRMQADGATRFVEVGAGDVLVKLARRTLGRDVETATTGKVEELNDFVADAQA